MNDRTSKVETWDKVSETYLDEITDSEEEIAESIYSLVNSLPDIGEKISAIELGSGSGHLSAKMAMLGIDVSLLDFSKVALQKAKEIFDNHNLSCKQYLQDLFELDIDGDYDLAWNCGVMEHFNDNELKQIINKITAIKSKYYLFIVPNPESIPYMLYRHFKMRSNTWGFGIEFLRKNYIQFFEDAGFKLILTHYFGSKFTQYNLDIATKSHFPYSEYIQDNILNIDQHFLIGYLFSKEKDVKYDNNFNQEYGITFYKTKIFDQRAQIDFTNDILYATNLQKEKLELEIFEKEKSYKEQLEHITNEKEKAIKLNEKSELLLLDLKSELEINKQLVNDKNQELILCVNEIEKLKSELTNNENELNLTSQKLKENEKILQDIKNSKSWKYTSIFRK